MNQKILIVDDDKDLAGITGDLLKTYGYEPELAGSCEEAFAMLTEGAYALVILDINLPDGTGFEVVQELREVSGVPVIFASARTSEDDKITGLELGGDDYLAKPYSLRELIARVNALMRRTYGADSRDKVYELGSLTVDTGLRRVEKGGEEIRLALKEFDVLAYLCEHKNQTVKKEELLRDVWGAFSEAEPATVAVHIRWLREKLEEDPANPRLIQTVWGVGYRLVWEGGEEWEDR